jgi:hypothetical protein
MECDDGHPLLLAQLVQTAKGAVEESGRRRREEEGRGWGRSGERMRRM